MFKKGESLPQVLCIGIGGGGDYAFIKRQGMKKSWMWI
jgi:hypothetical protein